MHAYFYDRSFPQNRETAYSPHEREAIERIYDRIVQSGESLAHEIILEARRDALLDVDDREAASTHANQELDQFLSERMDGAR